MLFLRTAFFPGGPAPQTPRGSLRSGHRLPILTGVADFFVTYRLLSWGPSPPSPPVARFRSGHGVPILIRAPDIPSYRLLSWGASPPDPPWLASLGPWCAHTYQGSRYPFVPSPFLGGQPPRPPRGSLRSGHGALLTRAADIPSPGLLFRGTSPPDPPWLASHRGAVPQEEGYAKEVR